ncbi:MAG TPA: class I SAM-dependent methyltransferase [Quisquiliibacterium sp.]|nr:class I SAM-dependent methyltransferase [Quisquiliibacterium sp.]
MNDPIIEATGGGRSWLDAPASSYLLRWEQAGFDAAVADVFGYYAVQVGLGELDCLRANRISCRVHGWFAGDPAIARRAGVSSGTPPAAGTADAPDPASGRRPAVRIDHPEELPFATQSLDLVALPHVLEFATDPHEVLREVERVLRPEGRLIVSGLNPISLWGARHLLPGGLPPGTLPPGELARRGHLIAQPRLRDWLKLLGFEPDRAQYGCYRPPCGTQAWLDRTAFFERAGDRWWPICGGVYLLSAVKRVRAMRLVGPAWKKPAAARARAPVAVASVQSPLQAQAQAPRAARVEPPVSGTCSRETAAAD